MSANSPVRTHTVNRSVCTFTWEILIFSVQQTDIVVELPWTQPWVQPHNFPRKQHSSSTHHLPPLTWKRVDREGMVGGELRLGGQAWCWVWWWWVWWWWWWWGGGDRRVDVFLSHLLRAPSRTRVGWQREASHVVTRLAWLQGNSSTAWHSVCWDQVFFCESGG